MITKTQILQTQPDISTFSYLSMNFTSNSKEYLFFDIETTGFSSKNSFCYLIGVIYYSSENTWMYTQWLAEAESEEYIILNNFFNFITNYAYLISFNGDGFDIPFLTERFSKLSKNTIDLNTVTKTSFSFDNPFNNIVSLDILKLIRPLKKLLSLENLKQKTIENFLNIFRNDKYSGGDLIKFYQIFCKEKDSKLLELILLHNHDDITGLINILPILNYLCIVEEKYQLTNFETSEYSDYNNNLISECLFTLSPECTFPVEHLYINEQFAVKCNTSTFIFRVKLSNDTLKYFYSNYKDYYYIPNEDQAIHKSVASFIDKQYREKAKASNCYVHKCGSFIPQLEPVIFPEFKTQYNDSISFFELNNKFISDKNKQLAYVKSTLRKLL